MVRPSDLSEVFLQQYGERPHTASVNLNIFSIYFQHEVISNC